MVPAPQCKDGGEILFEEIYYYFLNFLKICFQKGQIYRPRFLANAPRTYQGKSKEYFRFLSRILPVFSLFRRLCFLSPVFCRANERTALFPVVPRHQLHPAPDGHRAKKMTLNFQACAEIECRRMRNVQGGNPWLRRKSEIGNQATLAEGSRGRRLVLCDSDLIWTNF